MGKRQYPNQLQISYCQVTNLIFLSFCQKFALFQCSAWSLILSGPAPPWAPPRPPTTPQYQLSTQLYLIYPTLPLYPLTDWTVKTTFHAFRKILFVLPAFIHYMSIHFINHWIVCQIIGDRSHGMKELWQIFLIAEYCGLCRVLWNAQYNMLGSTMYCTVL